MEICERVPPDLAILAPGERETVYGPIDLRPGRDVACHLYPESVPAGEETA
jgi:hypothetical protein